MRKYLFLFSILVCTCSPILPLSCQPAQALEVSVHIRDGLTQEPLAAWCELTDPSGKYFFPQEDKVRGEHEPDHFYAWDNFKVDLKTDVVYTLKVRKGLGWFPFEEELEISEEQTQLTISMTAWYRPMKQNWIAGDLEGRWSFVNPALPLAAWDLNAAFRIVDASAASLDNERLSAGVFRLPGKRSYTGRDWGYRDFNVLRTSGDPPVNETGFGRTFLEEMFIAKDRAGLIDVIRPQAREMPVAAAHDLITSIRVLGPEGPNDDKTWEMDRILERLDRYYDFLNCGFHLPIGAGSAATEKGKSKWDYLGANRLFCRVPRARNLGQFLSVYRKGCSWATNGPILSLMAEGNRDLGFQFDLIGPNSKVDLSMGARSPRSIDRLELLYNGEVVRSFPGSATSYYVLKKVELRIPQGGWIAARVFEVRENPDDPIRYAHTSPIYFDVRGTDSFDRDTVHAFATQVTEDYNRWAKDETLSEREKSLLLEWYGFARDFYLEKLN